MANRLTQIAVESLEISGNPHLRLTQAALESIQPPGNPNLRLTQVALELIITAIPLSCDHPPNATLGTAYSHNLLALGGTAPFNWVVTAGTLPPGLTLDIATGHISGTPTSIGPFTFVVSVWDTDISKILIDSGGSLPPLMPGEAATSGATWMGYNNLGNPYWSIIIEFETPAVVPSGVMSYQITVQDTDSSGNPSPDYYGTERDFLNHAPDPSTVYTDVLIGGYQPSPTSPYTYITFRIYSVDGSGVRTIQSFWPGASYAVNYGTVPSTAPTSTMVFIGTLTCSINVVGATPPLTLDCNNPPDGILGTSYYHNIVGGGGVPPYTFSITGGSLPLGLSLAPATGYITGVPTQLGVRGFTVKVTDSRPVSTTINCTITINSSGGTGGGPGGGGSSSGCGPGLPMNLAVKDKK